MIVLFIVVYFVGVNTGEFFIDWEHDRFVKDGETFQYASGGMHYFRIPYQYWGDRIYSARSAGLNTIESYVIWNLHEPQPGIHDFSGDLNLVGFIEEVKKQNMSLILRVGPYICAERNFGGLPPWLWSITGIQVRTLEKNYINAVRAWLAVLLPKIKPYLYENGGPIIMVQVENEYGSFGCDKGYMEALRDQFRTTLGEKVVLFTTDGKRDWELKCGITPGLFATVDFSPADNMTDILTRFRKHQEGGPIVNSELYAGWCDYWRQTHAMTDAGPLGKTFDSLLSVGASVNLYMWHGGSNFGLTTGGEQNIHPNPTSYDYDAPVSEWGDIKPDKYWTIRNITNKYFPGNTLPAPLNTRKLSDKMIRLYPISRLTDQLNQKTFIGRSMYPMTMEKLGLYEGIVGYRHTFVGRMPIRTKISISGVHDRAYVLADNRFVKVIKRDEMTPVEISNAKNVTILVENFGYIGFGEDMANYTSQYKGMMNVSIEGFPVTDWDHFNISVTQPLCDIPKPLDNLELEQKSSYLNIGRAHKKLLPNGPVFYSGELMLERHEQLDTFLDTTGWSKGYLLVNGRMVGRYWPDAGPQYTLFIPGVHLKEGSNKFTLVELQSTPKIPIVKLTDKPNINGPVNPQA